jgi:DNA primase
LEGFLAYFDNSWVEQLKVNAPIESIIGEYLPIKPRGGRWIGLCPFHQDSSPSFYVTPHLGIYKCFACGAGGDVIKFISEFEKIDFSEAIKLLAEKTGTPLPESKHDKKSDYVDSRTQLLSAHKEAEAYYHKQFLANDQAMKYLISRGINMDTCKKFGVGLAPDAWNSIGDYLTPKGFAKKDLVSSGLLIENDKGKVYDRFRNRILFPIRSSMGKTIGFGGRAISPDDKAKYLNSPETPIYQKSGVLYGFDMARKAASEKRELILVEGYFDVIQLNQAGIENVVAVSGTALTKEHAELIHRYVDKVFLFFDGDQAGEKAIERSLSNLLPVNLEIKTYLFPEGEDPDSLVAKGGQAAINEIKDKSMSWIDFRLRNKEHKSSPEAVARLAEVIQKDLSLISQPLLRETLAKDISSKLNLSIQHFVRGKSKAPAKRQNTPQSVDGPSLTKGAEQRLVVLLLNNAQLLSFAHAHFDLNLLKQPALADLLDRAFEFFENNESFEIKLFYSTLNEYWQNFLESQSEEIFGKDDDQIKEYMQTLIRFELDRLLERWAYWKSNAHIGEGFEIWQEMKQYVSTMRKIKSRLFESDGREQESFEQYLHIASEVHNLVLKK